MIRFIVLLLSVALFTSPALARVGHLRHAVGPPPLAQAELNAKKAKAEAGDMAEQGTLCTLYEFGEGVPRDKAEALKWCHLASDQGDIGAAFSLGQLYEQSHYNEPSNILEAYMWYTISDVPVRGFSVGTRSTGDPASNVKSQLTPLQVNDAEDMAAQYMKAETGNTDEQENIAKIFEDGDKLDQDYPEAYFWYSLATEKNTDNARHKDEAAGHLTPEQTAATDLRVQAWHAHHPPKK